MNFGIIAFPTDYSIQPMELARAVEERGFESLFVTEHTHIPVSRQSPSYIPGDLPREYWHTHDAFVALTAAAAVTTELKIGTGVCLVTEHNVMGLAKQVASLDYLSGGRFIFGIGAGWNAEEMADHGVAFNDRWKITRERVLAMREIWTNDEAEYHGEFVDFEPLWSWPKPAQEGGPPILMGANSKWSYDRIADYCDGWLGLAGLTDPTGAIDKIRASAEKAGRPMSDFDITVAGELNPENIEYLSELGVTRIVAQIPSETGDTVLPMLDGWAEIIERYQA
jgi:probable F420-dependent oxidoreductase